MKQPLVVLLATALSLSHSPLRADSSETETLVVETPMLAEQLSVDPEKENQEMYSTDETTPITEETPPDEQLPSDIQDDAAVVGPAENSEAYKRARNKTWQNILLAVCVVTVAVTALIIVANHEGHKSHD